MLKFRFDRCVTKEVVTELSKRTIRPTFLVNLPLVGLSLRQSIRLTIVY